ncbi:Kazal-type serine protease inhibitor [Phytophthora megakarya]|uniref:Kazal-type serine protease inhibitor n=1 Tax=Phytophthora megakarya TaxID=4795 RepID=A0A225WM92_9STRA|nr:Kazal-type serine protease inhibitor [Phytophthora megakarya]
MPLSDNMGDQGLDGNLQTEPKDETNPEVDISTIFCSLTCKLTPDEVCGTDGVTYINDCHLLSSKCANPHLEKASNGACQNINLNILEVGEGVIAEAAMTAVPEKCNPMCERVYDPICGSDGVTYANSCLLEYAECRNPNVKPFGAGKCPPHMQAARNANNPASTINSGESCIPGPCPYTYAPVCGSDGQTHDNLCLFANARCQHPQHALTIVHDGECDADTKLTCETMTCPTFTECREQIEPDNSVVAYCADLCSPDRCSEREDCELVDSDCFTAPCSPIAMCVPKIEYS